MTVRRHAWALLAAAVFLMLAAFIVYRLLPIAGVALGVGSGVAAAVLTAHLGVLAALLAVFGLRRRSNSRKT